MTSERGNFGKWVEENGGKEWGIGEVFEWVEGAGLAIKRGVWEVCWWSEGGDVHNNAVVGLLLSSSLSKGESLSIAGEDDQGMGILVVYNFWNKINIVTVKMLTRSYHLLPEIERKDQNEIL